MKPSGCPGDLARRVAIRAADAGELKTSGQPRGRRILQPGIRAVPDFERPKIAQDFRRDAQVAIACRVGEVEQPATRLRGRGHGRDLLEEAERRLAAEGVRHFLLHARENAAGFYRTCGYHAVGGIFTEVGRPHVKMEKHLPA